jgi:anaerobic selenocysteine-containing dehydrogenase
MLKEDRKNVKSHFRTCNLCEAMCGLEIVHSEREILSIKGDRDDPFSKGFICPKAVALQDIYHDEDRLREPVKKTAEGWKKIGWEEAFDLVSTSLLQVQARHGNDAVGVYQGNPTVHNLGSMLFSPPFVRTLRTRNKFSATSVDQLPHHLAAQLMFGHLLLLPVPDIDRTDYFLVLGGNPMVSNGSIMTAAGFPERMKRLKERGGKWIVIDPRRTESAEKADQHLFITPGTDIFFLGAVIHEIIRNGTIKISELHFKVDGLDKLLPYFDRFEPEKVAELTGISTDQIKQIAHDFGAAKSAVCYGRMGVSTQEHGSLCQWMINLINILTGNFDRPGGAMFAKPAFDSVRALSPKSTMKRFNRWQSRVSKVPEIGGELPVSVLAEECLTPGEGQIRAMVVSCGNPVLSTPNGKQLEHAFENLDFMVSVDIYINETSRLADVILPPATGLECDHFDLIFNNFAVRDTVKYSEPLFSKAENARYDWQIFKSLYRRMAKKRPWLEKVLIGWLTPRQMVDLGLRFGPYALNLKKLKRNIHGIDLGPLKSQLPSRLFTENKKVNLAPELFTSALDKLQFERKQLTHFLMIGRRHLRSNNSWMHNAHRLVKGAERCTALINPEDATRLKLGNGDKVEVKSEAGVLQITVELTNEMMPGVISIPHGWGHNRPLTKWKIAEKHPGVSVNDLTSEKNMERIGGNAILNGVPVSVKKVA